VQDAPTTQKEESQVVHEEHNALKESIGEEDVLPPQDTSHQAPTNLREIPSHPFLV
jgi:hypothetical protein